MATPTLQVNVVEASQPSIRKTDLLSNLSNQELDVVDEFYTPPSSIDEVYELNDLQAITNSFPVLRSDDFDHQVAHKKVEKKKQCISNISLERKYSLRSKTSHKLEKNANDGLQPSTSSSHTTVHVAHPQIVKKRKYTKKSANISHSLEENTNDGCQVSSNPQNVPKRKYVKKRANASGSLERNTDDSTQSPTSYSQVTEHVVDPHIERKGKNIKKRLVVSTADNVEQNVSSHMSNSSFETSINNSQRYNRIKCRIETRLTLIKRRFSEIADYSVTDVSLLLTDEADSLIQSPRSDVVTLSDDSDD